MRKVVITGASGFIGGALARRLLTAGVRVYGVGRDAGRLDALREYGDFVPVIADFERYDRLHEMVDERGFDMFWHLAWRGVSTGAYNDYGAQSDNVKAAGAAATAAAALRCARVSCVSTNYQQANAVIAKGATLNPLLYGVVKKCAADMFKAISYKNNIPCVNLIFPNTFGPGDKTNTAIVSFIKALLAGRPLNLISGERPDDWMPIDDLVDGIIQAAGMSREYVDYYVGHRQVTTFKEKLLTMRSVLRSNSELSFGTYLEAYYVDYGAFDLDALYNDTGFEAKTDFAASILQTADWLKSISQEEGDKGKGGRRE
jgi:nucleoside-diphosphate-sugar epimerase